MESKAREQQALAIEAAELLESMETQVTQVIGVTSAIPATAVTPDVRAKGRTHSCGV